jgi:hypothetical protein
LQTASFLEEAKEQRAESESQEFVIGLICPHEGGFAIKLTEKIEDLVAVIFLPLYFTPPER